MAWFRCQCGYMTQIEPREGEIVSAYHLHRQSRIDGTVHAIRMELLPDPVPEPALATAGSPVR